MSDYLQQKCPNSIRDRIQLRPQDPLDLILRVEAITSEHEQALTSAGFQIRHALTLVPTYAVHGPGEALLTVLDNQWLISVEPDAPVRGF